MDRHGVVLVITLGEASALNAAVYGGPGTILPEGWKKMEFMVDKITGLTLAHYAQGSRNYLAIRGTWSKADVLPALRVFLGADPVDRIQVVHNHIVNRFGERIAPGTLAVGGHSLGGLVAASAAERFHLPGLAQNSPGWMARVPDASRLNKFIQVRTARDVVADWGTNYPRNLMLPDPSLPMWGVSSLHNLEHQNKLIEEYGLAGYRVDDPTLDPTPEPVLRNPDSQLARFARSIDRWRTGRDYTELHERLAGPAKTNTPTF